jgi:hypothetical protein
VRFTHNPDTRRPHRGDSAPSVRPWSSWDEEWPVDLDFVNELAAAFLQAGFRHIAVQNTRNPVQRMNDVAAATLAHRRPRRSAR